MPEQHIAVISDIHANAAAFEAVKEDIENKGISRIWCLGDIVGRGPAPLSARSVMRLYNEQSVLDKQYWLSGNHDWLVLKKIKVRVLQTLSGEYKGNTSGMSKSTIEMAHSHRDRLEHQQDIWEWLDSLPPTAHIQDHIYLAHGLYIENNDGIDIEEAVKTYGKEVNLTRMIKHMLTRNIDKPHLIMVGHTHEAGAWRWDADKERVDLVKDWEVSQTYSNLAKSPIVINTGSVGFPRNGNGCPSYATLRFEDIKDSVQVEFHEVSYNYADNEIPEDYPKNYLEEMKRCSR